MKNRIERVKPLTQLFRVRPSRPLERSLSLQ